MKQGEYELLQDYYECFKSYVAWMFKVGAVFVDDSLAGQVALSNGKAIAIDKDWDGAWDQAIANTFTRGTNKHHQVYLQELCNQYLNKHNVYPSTLTNEYNVMVQRPGNRVQHIPTGDGLTFITTSTTQYQIHINNSYNGMVLNNNQPAVTTTTTTNRTSRQGPTAESMRMFGAMDATIMDITRATVLLVVEAINNSGNSTSLLVFHSCNPSRPLTINPEELGTIGQSVHH